LVNGCLTVDEKGICFQTMDATHVALVDNFVKNTLAENNKCLSPCQLGIDFKNISQNIKVFRHDIID
ncbi:hypothetical protein BDK51DRAFT_16833, partial [Blyttiomyces helicus]